MTGYLERLVDRHAGPPAVRPRAVSRFEGDLLGRPIGSEPSAAASDDVVGSLALAAVEAPTPAIASTRPIAPAAAATAVSRSGVVAARDRIDVPLPLEGVVPALPSPAASARSAPQPERPSNETGHDDPGRTTIVEGSTVAPVTIRRAAPKLVAPAESYAGPSRRLVEVTAREPDVVHVHIGRVEVRAAVPAPGPARPTARPARAGPLSLDRYLSRERRT